MSVLPNPRKKHPQKFCLNHKVRQLLSHSPAHGPSLVPPSPLPDQHPHLITLQISSRDILAIGPRVPAPVHLYGPAMVTQVQVERVDAFLQRVQNPNVGFLSRASSVGGKTRMNRGRSWRGRRRKASWLDLMEQSFTCFHLRRSNIITGLQRPNLRIQPRNRPSSSPINQTLAVPLVMETANCA